MVITLMKKNNRLKTPDAIRLILKKVIKAHKKDFDTLFIITGHEGMGKSNLMLCILEEYIDQTKQDIDIDFIAFDQNQFINAIDKAPNNIGYIAFDEAGDGLLSRDAMSETNKDLVKTFMIIRAKGLFTILVLPSFWYVDKYFREERVKALFHVYRRGEYAFWNKKQIKDIIEYGDHNRRIFSVRPSFYGKFPIYTGKLLNDYKLKKKEKIEKTIKDMKNKHNDSANNLNEEEQYIYDQLQNKVKHKDIAEALGCSSNKISKTIHSIQNKGFKIYKIPNATENSTN